MVNGLAIRCAVLQRACSARRCVAARCAIVGVLRDCQGKTRDAASLYERLLATQQRVLGAEHKDTLDTAMQLAGAILNLGRAVDAEALYRRILALLVRTIENNRE